jgi:hypothetical protein
MSFFTARGDWAALAGAYRYRGAWPTTRWRFQDGDVGREQYENGLTMGVDANGLYLAIVFLFRAGHPQLFIPWSEISATEEERFQTSYTVFHFRSAPTVPLRVGQALGRWIVAAAGPSWPNLCHDNSGMPAARV